MLGQPPQTVMEVPVTDSDASASLGPDGLLGR